MNKLIYSDVVVVCSGAHARDVMVAILVLQNNETAVMLVHSYLM